MSDPTSHSPDWERLFARALEQEGLFTTEQALEAGYSRPLLAHHVKAGRIVRVRRGIYRLVHFPAGESEHLVAIWLWSEQQGVFSHETALAMFDLSDAMPSRIHVTLPMSWRRRRLRVPDALSLHYADLGEQDRTWIGSVKATTPRRTLIDCARDHVAFDLLHQALEQSLARGLVTRAELPENLLKVCDTCSPQNTPRRPPSSKHSSNASRSEGAT